ncbi:MAG TPA: DUF4142 domain-containing protein [Acidobacteriaceae bacterium]|jgi:putative membrane protein|nr:DUF4142 domain-containing protein [Acidobacteriaceae bacterium]
MKKILCVAALGCATILTNASARAQNDQDKTFLATASQSDFNEIKLSQLAADKASDADVKMFAQKMVTDHQMLEQNMKPFADQWGVTPATSLDTKHQALYDQMSGLSGKDFDKAYMKAMDEDHHVAQTDFVSEKQLTKNKEFKTQVSAGEKIVSGHTKMADRLCGKLGVSLPAGATGATGVGSSTM